MLKYFSGMIIIDEIEEIKAIIEKLRDRLHGTVQGRCLTDPEVVKASQELNEMLNKYEKILTDTCKKMK